MDDAFMNTGSLRLTRVAYGGVLLIALIIVAAVSILSASVFYAIKSNILQHDAIGKNNDMRNVSFLSTQSGLTTLQSYTNTPADSSSNYSSDNYTTTINKETQTIAPDSLALNSASAMMRYKIASTTTDTTSGRVMTHETYDNTPSQYQMNGSLSPATTQNVNIPTIILANLENAQKNGSTINVGQAGFIGRLSVVPGLLAYQPTPATTPTSVSMTLPTLNSFAFTQAGV